MVALTPREVFDRVRTAGTNGSEFLFVRGMYSGRHRPHRRIGIFLYRDAVPNQLVDCWLAENELDLLKDYLEPLGRVNTGGSDGMFALAWSHVWENESATLWSRERREVWVTDGVVYGVGKMPVRSVQAVNVWAAEDRVRRGVSLEVPDAQITVWEAQESVALLDPTYDYLDMDGDMAPMENYACCLAARLGVPFLDRR